MTIYGIYACETDYEGLHGMNETDFIECNCLQDATIEAQNMCLSVMENYSFDYLNEDEDSIYEHMSYTIFEICEECPYSLFELRAESYHGFEELTKKYGKVI